MDLSYFYQKDEQGQVITGEGSPLWRTPGPQSNQARVEAALAQGKQDAALAHAGAAIESHQWDWLALYQAWQAEGEALAAQAPVQARDESGAFVADDPATAEDEAWVEGYSPELHQAALDAHAALEPPRPPIPTVDDYLANCAGWDHHRKLQGVEFEGVRYSATAEDMWGLAAIKDQVRAGLVTPFKFDNGNTLELTPANIDAFEAVWVPFRAQFFA